MNGRIGGTNSLHARDNNCVENLVGKSNEKKPLWNVCVAERIILKKYLKGLISNNLAQNRV
jgi:hypothetical protein